MKQKAIIVRAAENDPGLEEVNELIGEGEWCVVKDCPMPSSCSAVGDDRHNHVTKIVPTCLLILEKIN